MTDRLAQLIQAVEEADSSKLLVQAVQNLANAKLEGAITTLIEALSYNNPGAAVAAVDGLIALGNLAVPALLELLDRHNYTARSWAIRALAGIGDPRGLVTLLGVATADFAFSVRRAAVKGLGLMKWHWFPDEVREIAQAEAIEALLFVSAQDEEWVVRYASVVGLEAISLVIAGTYPEWIAHIQSQLNLMSCNDENLAVRGRVWLAQSRLEEKLHQLQIESTKLHNPILAHSSTDEDESPLTPSDWQGIMSRLYEMKRQERMDSATKK